MQSINSSAATRSNKALPLTRLDWQIIQMRSGSEPDGLPGALTAQAIAAAQLDAGLPVTGIADKETQRELAKTSAGLWGRCKTLGLYWDRRPTWTRNKKGLIEEFEAQGHDEIIVMTNSSKHKEQVQKWTPADLAWLRGEVEGFARVSLCPWVLPDRERMRRLKERLPEQIKKAKARRVILDCEGHNSIEQLRYRRMSQVEWLGHVAEIIDIIRANGAEAWVTTFPQLLGKAEHDEHIPQACAMADGVSLQVYATEAGDPSPFGKGGIMREVYLGVLRYRERVGRVLGEGRSLPRFTVAYAMWDRHAPEGEGIVLDVEQGLRMDAEGAEGWSGKHGHDPRVAPETRRRYVRAGHMLIRQRREVARGGCA